MVDEMIRDNQDPKSVSRMDVSEATMKAIGFSQHEIDQARKPDGYWHNGTVYRVVG